MTVTDQTPDARRIDARTNTVPDAREGKATDRSIEEKMPSSVQDFGQGMARVHNCDNCGEPTTGKCSSCGYEHPELRSNPNNPNE